MSVFSEVCYFFQSFYIVKTCLPRVQKNGQIKKLVVSSWVENRLSRKAYVEYFLQTIGLFLVALTLAIFDILRIGHAGNCFGLRKARTVSGFFGYHLAHVGSVWFEFNRPYCISVSKHVLHCVSWANRSPEFIIEEYLVIVTGSSSRYLPIDFYLWVCSSGCINSEVRGCVWVWNKNNSVL